MSLKLLQWFKFEQFEPYCLPLHRTLVNELFPRLDGMILCTCMSEVSYSQNFSQLRILRCEWVAPDSSLSICRNSAARLLPGKINLQKVSLSNK